MAGVGAMQRPLQPTKSFRLPLQCWINSCSATRLGHRGLGWLLDKLLFLAVHGTLELRHKDAKERGNRSGSRKMLLVGSVGNSSWMNGEPRAMQHNCQERDQVSPSLERLSV